jgi:hypothetical protein
MTTEEREQQERESCPACQQKRLHTPEDWQYHPGSSKSPEAS